MHAFQYLRLKHCGIHLITIFVRVHPMMKESNITSGGIQFRRFPIIGPYLLGHRQFGSQLLRAGVHACAVYSPRNAVAASRSSGTGVVRIGSLGQSATPGPARLTRPTDAEDSGTDAGVEQEVEKRPVTRRLRTHPGVGALTALAFEL